MNQNSHITLSYVHKTQNTHTSVPGTATPSHPPKRAAKGTKVTDLKLSTYITPQTKTIWQIIF